MTQRFKFPLPLILGVFLFSFFIFWAFGYFLYKFFASFNLIPFALELELMAPNFDSWTNFLGRDVFGRPLLFLLSEGLLYSLGLSFIVSFSTLFLGVFLAYAALRGHFLIKKLINLATDLIFTLPSILLAIFILSLFNQSFWSLTLILIITGWPGYAKIAHEELKRLLAFDFVEASLALGCSERHLLFRVLFPCLIPLFQVYFFLNIIGVLITESVLSFLGLGNNPYSWGILLSQGKDVLLEAPHVAIITSIPLILLLLSLQLISEGFKALRRF